MDRGWVIFEEGPKIFPRACEKFHRHVFGNLGSQLLDICVGWICFYMCPYMYLSLYIGIYVWAGDEKIKKPADPCGIAGEGETKMWLHVEIVGAK
jgi:hypothetical protein